MPFDIIYDLADAVEPGEEVEEEEGPGWEKISFNAEKDV